MLKERWSLYSNWLLASTNKAGVAIKSKLQSQRKKGGCNISSKNDGLEKASQVEGLLLAMISGKFNKIRNNLNELMSMVKMYVPLLMHFDGFPNYHIRTNAFMIDGALMRSFRFKLPKNKMDGYIFESGKRSLTKQVLGKGLKVIVVGKDGIGYEKETWSESKVFWRHDQENLLVADNQTRRYQQGTVEERSYLSSLAWNVTDYIEKV